MSYETYQEAIVQVCDNAGEEWKAAAYEAFVEYAKRGEPFMTEDVRLNSNVPDPHDNRAWGNIAVIAKKNNIVKSLGLVPSKSKKGRYYKVLWQAL